MTLVTTFVALLVNALALVALDMREYRGNRLAQVRIQAEILARASAAAVAFNDRAEAETALSLLREDPDVLAAAIYLPGGQLFASYERAGHSVPGAALAFPSLGYEADHIRGYHAIPTPQGDEGSIWLEVRSGLYARLYRYFGILAVVMLGALAVAIFLSTALQRAVTAPVVAVTRAARRVVEQHDYSVRAAPQPGYETALLAEAFNHMLSEIERRAAEVEREIAERTAAEQSLREADERKNRFLALLAHELRNPLAPIMSAVHALKMPALAETEKAKLRDVIDRQVRRMARLLDDLLDVGRVTNDKLELRRQRVELAAVIDAAVESSRPPVEEAGHSLEVSLPEETIELDVDPMRIAQVVSNLLNNAAKYTNRGGRIRLAAAAAGPYVDIEVSDNGIGMSEAELKSLFNIFAQAASGAHLSRGGLGLGLFLVKSLTEMHGGAVSAYSAGAGQGSRFVVRLPTARVIGSRPAPRAPEETGACKAARILVVDDNADAAEALAAMLRVQGHAVRTTFDGRAALAAARVFEPDVAFVDIGMPGMNGYEVARAIRASVGEKRLWLVAVTGWGQAEDKARALEAGFDEHLTKPAPVEAIDGILRRYAQRRQHAG